MVYFIYIPWYIFSGVLLFGRYYSSLQRKLKGRDGLVFGEWVDGREITDGWYFCYVCVTASLPTDANPRGRGRGWGGRGGFCRCCDDSQQALQVEHCKVFKLLK